MNPVPVDYEGWVDKFVHSTAMYFNLNGWTIITRYAQQDSNDTTYAENLINSTYLTSTITFSTKAQRDFKEGNIRWLATSIIHELAHIFFDPLHDAIDPFLSRSSTPSFMNILEQQTQKLTIVLMKNLPEHLLDMIKEVTLAKDSQSKESSIEDQKGHESIFPSEQIENESET